MLFIRKYNQTLPFSHAFFTNKINTPPTPTGNVSMERNENIV